MKLMPKGSYPFPIYSGILEPEHYKKIGSAIWLFLWCISSTTTEQEKEGTVWGIVLGGKPMKLSEISHRFGVNDKTVSRWLDTLEQHNYIQVTRAARGLILQVKNSKKRSDKNVRSHQNDKTEMSDHSGSDKTIMSDHEPNLPSDRTNMSDLKDIKDLITTTTANDSEFPEELLTPVSQGNGILDLLNAYCKMHNKLDIHVNPNEREAMGKMVAGGTPNPFTIQTMASLLEAKREREGVRFKLPKSFLYYVEGIQEAWESQHPPETPTTDKNHKLKKASSGITKKKQSVELLRRKAREERQREQSGCD